MLLTAPVTNTSAWLSGPFRVNEPRSGKHKHAFCCCCCCVCRICRRCVYMCVCLTAQEYLCCVCVQDKYLCQLCIFHTHVDVIRGGTTTTSAAMKPGLCRVAVCASVCLCVWICHTRRVTACLLACLSAFDARTSVCAPVFLNLQERVWVFDI